MHTITEFITRLASEYGYWFMAIAMYIDSVNIPAGSEIILPLGGYMSKVSSMNIYVLVLVTSVSTTLGALTNYYLGYWGGEVFFKKHRKVFFISEKEQQLAIDWFKKYGNFTAFLGRLIPGVRTFISFPAGVARVKFIPFAIYSLLGSIVWCSAFCSAGYFLGKNWDLIEPYLKKFHIVIILAAAALVVLFIRHRLKDKNTDK